jgi:hypothetical protein
MLTQFDLMKALSRRLRFLLASLLLGVCGVLALPAFGQLPGPGTPAGLNLQLMRLFGSVTGFTARASIRVLDSAQQEVFSAPMDFTVLDNKIRLDMEITDIKYKDLPTALAGSLKQLGFSKIVSVVRPDKLASYVMYPEQQIYLSMPLSKEDADSAMKPVKTEKTALGKDTLDGKAYDKSKVLLRQEGGKTLEATVWTAPEMKDFPMQVLSVDGGNTSIIHFKDVRFVKPEATRFDLPSGFVGYNTYQEFLGGLMRKMMGGGGDAN